MIEDGRWTFRTASRTSTQRYYTSETIQNAAAIYSAQQLRRIADELEALRKHVTRLQLVAQERSASRNLVEPDPASDLEEPS